MLELVDQVAWIAAARTQCMPPWSPLDTRSERSVSARTRSPSSVYSWTDMPDSRAEESMAMRDRVGAAAAKNRQN